MPSTKKSKQNKVHHGVAGERDRLKSILDSMDDGIYIVGRDYKIRFMNRALRSDVGEGEGQYCYDFFNHDRSSCEECQHGMSSFGPLTRREWFLPRTQRFYDVLISPIHEPGGKISRLHILRDITERKRLENALQEYSKTLETKVAEQSDRLLRQERLAILGEIWAGLAHEIRTPLGAIMTAIKLLEKSCPSEEEQRALFALLRSETNRLQRKLSEFLRYAKPRSPQTTEVGISALLEELRTLLTMERQLIGKVTMEVVMDPDLTVWPLDHDQTKESLLNICLNALQALDGKGMLTLEAKARGDTLELFVRDNGPGIPVDELPHIFKPFHTTKPGGTGLGLAISRQLIESQGGRISVTSIPRLNTTFKISIPHPKSSYPAAQDTPPGSSGPFLSPAQ
jgi:two-component system, NtrC family, sensor histidine kinase HydH